MGEIIYADWGDTLILTSWAASITVNTLVTGLIVFKILSVERSLGSLSSTAGNTKLRHIVYIIIESGMALFAIQLVRVVLSSLPWYAVPPGAIYALELVIGVHEMLIVIIRSVHFYFY